MQFYTVIGAIIVALCGLEGARRLNCSLQGEVTCADAYISLLRYVRGQIDCYALPIDEIFSHCGQELLVLCGWRDESPPLSFDELFLMCGARDKEVRSVLSEFSADFGRNYREEQLKRCDGCIEYLERSRDRLSSNLRQKKKLNLTLCLAASVALIILLI